MEPKTVDLRAGRAVCMAVGLSESQLAACKSALRSTELVCAADVADACARMASVRPLLVIIDARAGDDLRGALSEFTTACGSEILAISEDTTGLMSRLVDAMSSAELRRLRDLR